MSTGTTALPIRQIEPQTTPKLHEVLEFQQEALFPFIQNGRLAQKLKTRNWMGLRNGGLTFEDLEPTDAERLITLLGPSAFKVVRFSPDLLTTLLEAKKQEKPIITAGGSCLVTTADKNCWKAKPLSPERLRTNILSLPHLMQIFDASLPLHCADQHLNIIEDSLFAQLGHEYSDPPLSRAEFEQLFFKEGSRHSTHFQKLSWLFQSGAPVTPTHFSQLPVAEASKDFWHTPQVFKLIRKMEAALYAPTSVGQLQVMFSFTGSWANLLREAGHIPENSCYLVVEPFHHFTEAAERDQHLEKSTGRWKLYAGFDNLLTAQPYNEPGVNHGVQGGIAFMPVLAPSSLLGHTNLLLEDCCSYQNADACLANLRHIFTATKVPVPHDTPLFTDGLNYLFHLPHCREALQWLMQQTLIMRKAGSEMDKKARKDFLKGLRSNPDVLASSLERYSTLYQELENLVLHFFG